MKRRLIFVFIATLFCMSSCSLSNRKIEDESWKLSEVRENSYGNDFIGKQHHIDVLFFDETGYYELSGNSISRGDKPYADIVNRTKGNSLIPHMIEIVTVDTKDTLVYVSK